MLTHAGVIGDPARHSLSPAIHRAGYQACGLDWDYQAYTVTAAELGGFVADRLADPSWAGLSVTAPHKAAICALGEPDEPSLLLGAGNTLIFGERPRVYNTDVPGFVRAWRQRGLAAPRSAAIVGGGATARSILLALATLGTRGVQLLVRSAARAADATRLAADLGLNVEVRGLDEAPVRVDLAVNTIPAAATEPLAARLVASAGAVFDVVYDPWPTPLGREALLAGVPALNGLDLLAGQAVDQFFLMTGRRIDFELARSAAGQALSARGGL